MKKFLLIGLLFLGTITLTGCKENSLLGRLGFFNIMDGDGMVRSAEDICLSFDGQVSETEDGEAICILPNDEFCYMFDIEDGGCDLLGYEGDKPTSVICEENTGYRIVLNGQQGKSRKIIIDFVGHDTYSDRIPSYYCKY